MKMQKLFFTLLISGLCLSTHAQKSGTGQNEVEQRGKKNVGGPSHSNLSIPKTNDNVNLTDIEIQIDPATDGGINVTARGIKSAGVKGCDNCNVSGRIIITGNVGNNLEYETTTDRNRKAKKTMKANTAILLKVVLKNSTGQEYSVVTGSNGDFSLNNVPAGTYSIWVGGKEVILDYILTSTVAKAKIKSNNN